MSENTVKHADLKKKKRPKFELCLLKTLMISKFMKNWGGKLNGKYYIFCFFHVPGIMLYTLQALSYLNVGIVLCSF